MVHTARTTRQVRKVGGLGSKRAMRNDAPRTSQAWKLRELLCGEIYQTGGEGRQAIIGLGLDEWDDGDGEFDDGEEFGFGADRAVQASIA